MAQIVAGFGVPHTPVFPHLRQARRPRLRDRQAVRRAEGAARGDAARRHRDVRHRPPQHVLPRRPADLRGRRRQDLQRRRTTSRATCRTTWCRRRPISPRTSAQAGIEAGFDVGMTQNFSVDHSVAVPLHFLTPDMNVPVMPFFISGHVPPLPSAQRCYALGQAVGRAIEAWPANTARRGDGLAAASRSKSAARAWRPAAPTACPIRTGARGSSSIWRSSRSTS